MRDNLAAFVCGLDGCGAGAVRFAGGQALGEPPFMRAISVYEALRDAIASVGDGRPVRLTAPATAENVLWALAG